MPFCVTRLTREHYDEAVAMLGEAFATDGVPQNFEEIFPRLFRRDAEGLEDHFIAVPEGKEIAGNICGFISNCAMQYHVGAETLKISASGNVGVHRDARGQGLMTELFGAVERSLREDGFDLSYLHGARTRYRYYGYELCGVEYVFVFSLSDLEKRYRGRGLYRFVDLRERPELVQGALNIQTAQKAYVERRAEELVPALCALGRKPVAVLRKGRLVGSFAMGADGEMKYLSLASYEELAQMLLEYMQESGMKKITFAAEDYDKALLRACMKDNSSYSLRNPANFRIVNFEKVVRAFLQLKADNEPLCDGEITLDSDVFGKYRIALEGGKACVKPFEGEARYVLRGFEVYEFLFGCTPNCFGGYDAAVRSWLPLPLNAPYLS